MLVLISVKTGLFVALRVEVALHDILLVAPIVCACPVTRGIGDLHQAPAVEEGPCSSAVGSVSPGAVELVEGKKQKNKKQKVALPSPTKAHDNEILEIKLAAFHRL